MTFDMFSDAGERTCNEDCVGFARKEELFCFILADGLGGHSGGKAASSLAVKVIKEFFETDGSLTRACMEQGICRAQEALLALQEQEHKRDAMKTTVVILFTDGRQAVWGHVGDSRLYHFTGKKKWERTKDHSLTQVMADLGEIRDKDIRRHEDRSRLLHVLGVEWDEPPYEITELASAGPQDCFLLCSDGFWELIGEKDMVRCLKKAAAPEDWLDAMKSCVEKTGRGTGMDNYSAVAVWI